MNTSLAQQVHEVLAESNVSEQLACEPSLRIAAATVGRNVATAISGTRVVGVLGLDDVSALHALVANLADEYELEASVKIRVGSFTVHFSRGPRL